MQLSPISPLVSVHTAAMPLQEQPPRPGTGVGARPIAPAAPSAPTSIEQATDGVARLSTPIVDFPGIVTGDRFSIVKGSKVGFLGVKGDATILQLDDDSATFKVKAGAFGVKVDVEVQIERTGPDTVRISSRGSGIPDTTEEGRIIASRTNFAEFERIADPSEHTIISHDGNGRITIDTVVPTFGTAHLVLERRDA